MGLLISILVFPAPTTVASRLVGRHSTCMERRGPGRPPEHRVRVSLLPEELHLLVRYLPVSAADDATLDEASLATAIALRHRLIARGVETGVMTP